MMVAKEGNLCDIALLCRFLPNFCPEFLKCPEYVRVASDLDSASPQNGAGKGRRFVNIVYCHHCFAYWRLVCSQA